MPPPAPVVVAAPRDKVRGRAYVACESGKQKRPRLGRRLKSKYIRYQEFAVGLCTLHSSTGKVFDTSLTKLGALDCVRVVLESNI